MITVGRRDRGSAVLEFLIIGVLVLVPLLYALLTLLRLESAAMASTQAVREAARAFMMADSEAEGRTASQDAVALAMSDQGFVIPASALTIRCSPECLVPGSVLHFHLDWTVELPWLPPPFSSTDGGLPITVDYDLESDAYRSGVPA